MKFGLLAIFILLTYAIWLIVPHCLFFRDSWKILCRGAIYIAGVSLFPLWIYNYLKASTYDIAYLQILGTIIVASMLWFILKNLNIRSFKTIV